MAKGHLLLEGGAEFGGSMSEPDLRAIELAGGLGVAICIIPTAAAPDHNHTRAGSNGIRWFKSLGATHVFSLDIIDRQSANDSSFAASIRQAGLIYLLGGFPRHLGETLAHSACWDAALDAYEQGTVIAGSSAGAMVLCEHYFDPNEKKLLPGLNLIPNACVLPHHNKYGRAWEVQVRNVLPHATLLGIDERTGMINDADGKWTVHGVGGVTVYSGDQVRVHKRGEQFSFQGSGQYNSSELER
jgi:cyanophycinase